MSRRKSRECESRPAAAPTLSRSLLLSSPTGACIPATACSPANRCFDTSCFSGKYVTGDIDEAFFAAQAAEVRSNCLSTPCIQPTTGAG